MKKVNKLFQKYLHWFVVCGVLLLCGIFLACGHLSENGQYITLDGSDAQIPESTIKFHEEMEAAMYRLMNEDAPTDEATIKANENVEEGLGSYTTIQQVIARRKADGDNDGGNGWQCSKYTAYLATGRKDYSSAHPDYGPVNGKDVAGWLVKNFGWKYIDTPVTGAIGSGGFNTLYGHTAMYLYSTGANTAMVNDANAVPLTVATWNMNISGWVWVVPGNYTPEVEPTPSPAPAPETPVGDITHTVQRGETLGGIILGYGYPGKVFGDDGKAQAVADDNGFLDRGLIYPNQQIWIRRDW